MNDILQQAQSGILILDGALGTVIQRLNLQEEDFRGDLFKDFPTPLKGDVDLLCLTRPDVIADVHRSYLEAGADIIETCSFNSNSISQADYGMQKEVRRLNLSAAALARSEADRMMRLDPSRPRFVAGSMGPTSKSLSISPDVMDPALRSITFDEMYQAFLEQAEALIEGGVDALLVETAYDTLNMKAALLACKDAMVESSRKVPLMLSVTVSDQNGRILSGQDLDAVLASIAGFELMSFGLNCSFGASMLTPLVRHLSQAAPYLVSAYPNAGLPNKMGQYDETPEKMLEDMREMMDSGLVNIVGGCCGTTPEHIRLLYEHASSHKTVRKVPEKPLNLRLSGLDVLSQTPEMGMINVGERCNVCGSRKFLRLISEKKFDEALLIARRQVEDGAMVLDVNMDDGLLNAREEMSHFLRLLGTDPDIAKVPFMVDSSSWPVISEALKVIQGKPIVNSISLKEGEEVFLSRAREAKRMGAALVVMAFDEKGQANTFERRVEVCSRAYHLLVDGLGFPAQDIIFDPNVLAVATGMPEHDAYALDFIRATRWIREHLPHAHVSGGVSNLSFSFRGNEYIRQAMHAVFLYHAVQAGLDMAIVNPSAKVVYQDIPEDELEILEDVILCRRPDASERLTSLASEYIEKAKNGAGGASEKQESSSRNDSSVQQRLKEALRRGDTQYLDADLHEALAMGLKASDIIQGPLMDGMNLVGKLFSEGKMFLPQVVKTARTMKQAVSILEPYLKESSATGNSRGKIILATVKGDVHDIGKNIVAVVMGCNGYEVVDMGTMVPAEDIVECAQREKADMVGLSGLITPSLAEMVHVVELLKARGMEIPVLIGGAATSLEHTAMFISPKYWPALAIHVRDAAQDPIVAARLMDGVERLKLSHELEQTYGFLAGKPEPQKTVSLDEARKRRLDLFGD